MMIGTTLRRRAQRPADLVAVGPGAERHVEQHDVEVVGAGPVDRRAAVGDRHHPVALARERAREHLAQVGLVVDDEDAQRGVSAAGRERCRIRGGPGSRGAIGCHLVTINPGRTAVR